MKTPGLSIAFAILATVTGPAWAKQVYANDFDSENGGATALHYDGFTGLTVTYPSIDLLHTGDGNGVTCAGVGGGCIDLDGGTPGQIVSDAFDFRQGERLTWTFTTSGSQRIASPIDTAYYALRFDRPTGGHFSFVSSSGLTYSDDYGTVSDPFDPAINDVGLAVTAPYDYGFADVTFTFIPTTNAGSVRFLFDGYAGDGTDRDDAGRVIDDVAFDIAAVPEPSGWAMAIAGFGAIGAVSRERRRRAISPLRG